MTQTILDFDAILDANLGNVEDVPDYLTPPAGLYMLTCIEAKVDSYKNKEGGQTARLKLTHRIDATVECEELPPADGSLFTETFQATDDGLKYFKKAAKKMLNVDDMEGATIRDTLQTLEGHSFKAKITIRKSNSGGKDYENVQVRPIHSEEE